MNLETFVTTNYNAIYKACQIKNKYPQEMLSECYIYLNRKWPILSACTVEEALLSTYKFIHTSRDWSNSNFSKITAPQANNHLEFPVWLEHQDETEAFETINEDLIGIEHQPTKDLISDYYSTFRKEFADILIKIHLVYPKLNQADRILYDLTFKDNLSVRQIAKKTNIPPSSIFVMQKKLKNKIKNLIEEI